MAKSRHVRGQIVDTSHSGGLNVSQYWAMLFEQNEKNFEEGATVMDDEDITAAMIAAFPDRAMSVVLREVHRVRGRYNRGALPNQNGKPTRPSYRYRNLNGKAVRCTAGGTPMPENQRNQIPTGS